MALPTLAQETKPKNCNVAIGADLASMYLWRGMQQGSAPALQPWGEFSYKGLTLGTWGSYEFSGNFKEIDLYAKYTYKDFSLLFIDFFYPDDSLLDQNYYNFDTKTTGHASELGLSFNGNEKIPFSVYGGVFLYGTPIDNKVIDSATIEMNYSSYFEINYLGKHNDYTYNVFMGFTPTESNLYQTTGFAVFNVGLSAKKTVKVTSDFSIPIKLTLATNPEAKKIFIAFILSI
jgi:hypothetical protein